MLQFYKFFFRDAEVQRLDTKVISPLSQYSIICKHAREDVKNTFSIRDKELTKRRNLEKVRARNPRNRQMIVSFLFKFLTIKKLNYLFISTILKSL